MSAPNTVVVDLSDGRQVCFSYGVPVAAFIPKGLDWPATSPEASDISGYIANQRYRNYSPTTSRHINAFAASVGRNIQVVPEDIFMMLIHPLKKAE